MPRQRYSNPYRNNKLVDESSLAGDETQERVPSYRKYVNTSTTAANNLTNKGVVVKKKNKVNTDKNHPKCSNKGSSVLDSNLMKEESQLLMSLGLGSNCHTRDNHQNRRQSSSPIRSNNSIQKEETRDEINAVGGRTSLPCHRTSSVVRFVNPEITQKWFCPPITDPQILSSLFYSEEELNEFRQQETKYESSTRKSFQCLNNGYGDDRFHDYNTKNAQPTNINYSRSFNTKKASSSNSRRKKSSSPSSFFKCV